MKIFILFTLFFLGLSPAISFAQKGYTISGLMKHTDIEGGCWYLESKQQKYQLLGSPEILQTCQHEGRMLTLSVEDAKEKHSVCMIGKIVEVLQIYDSVAHAHNPPVYDKYIKGIVHKTKSGCWYVLTSTKHKYELATPIPKKFMRIGAKYNRMSKVIPGAEGNCDMEMVITISMLEPDMQVKTAREKKYDPR